MIAFAMLAAVAIFLATVSLFPEASRLYTSSWAMILWTATAMAACVVIVRRRLWERPAVFTLHLALLVILVGAMTTHLIGVSERQRVETGQSLRLGDINVRLDNFSIEYYPGTAAPSDFVASLTLPTGESMRISINRVGIIEGKRVFLTSYEAGGNACTFTINDDETGTTVSYCGYALLLLSMIWCSLPKRRSGMKRTAIIAACIAACLSTSAASEEATPKVLPRDVAAEFGRLFVYHADRVMPVSTLARNFSLKIYGTTSYRGLTPEQVLTGWLFYYSSWRNDRGIKIKDADTRRRMNLPDKYANLNDFFGPEGYLFEDADHAEANEKFGLVSSAATGSLWAIFPYRADSTGAVTWLTPVSDTPDDMPVDKWRMTRHSLNYVAELVAAQDRDKVTDTIRKIATYQQHECPDGLPTVARCRAEALFLMLSASIWPVVILFVAGLALLIWPRPKIASLIVIIAAIRVAAVIIMNWYASQHLPMSNGYETMQWMALSALVICLIFGRRQPMMLPLGCIVAALALAVAFMGQRNPQLTNLMPVLRSPLLSLHVLSVMLAYALLTIIALSSALWLCGRRSLLPLARRMLRPAVFILAVGIFIGAVWANTSWGRYWGWDPKETWALITLMVYCFPLHVVTLPSFGKDRTFAIWTLCAFATVLMTYIGANFLIPGLHSYA